MAALVSQVPSVNTKASSAAASSSSIVHPSGNNNNVVYSAENGVRWPVAASEQHGYLQGNSLDLGNQRNVQDVQAGDKFALEIVNVVTTFKTHCHIDLKTLARSGANVEMRRDPPSVVMRIRNPKITASVWSQGKVLCIGAKSDEEALIGARRVARKIQKCGFKVRFTDYNVNNVLAVVRFPFGIRIDKLKETYPREFQYEPELHPGGYWKLHDISSQMQIFQTGNCTVTAPSVAAVHKTVDIIYPRLLDFTKLKEKESGMEMLGARGSSSSSRKKRPQAGADPIRDSLKKLRLSIAGDLDDEDEDLDDEE